MTLTPITPLKAQGMLGDGAQLVDIRSPQEFAQAHALLAQNVPLGSTESFDMQGAVIFLCRTGRRCEINAAELSALCSGKAYRIDGGLEAWRKAELPLASTDEARQTLSGNALAIAGGLVLLGLLLGWARSAWFLVVPAAIALDMVRAGIGKNSALANAYDWVSSRAEKTRQQP